jgi:hypothetical protein
VTTYRARCGALIVRDVSPGPFVSVRNRLADYLEAQAQAPPPRNGNVHAATIFHINANRVRLWQEEGTYLASPVREDRRPPLPDRGGPHRHRPRRAHPRARGRIVATPVVTR